MSYFGNLGLRTLMFAERIISDSEYAKFIDVYNVSVLILGSLELYRRIKTNRNRELL